VISENKLYGGVMNKRYVMLLILSSLVIFLFSIMMGCGLVSRYTPLDETDIPIVISPNFDINKHRKVAVMPIYGIDRKDGFLELQATDAFATQLMGMGFTVVERTQLQRIFNELQLSMSGMLSKNDLNKVGKLLGIDMIVMGTAEGWNRNWTDSYKVASIRFVDTETGELLISIVVNRIKGRQYIPEMADVLKRRLAEKR